MRRRSLMNSEEIEKIEIQLVVGNNGEVGIELYNVICQKVKNAYANQEGFFEYTKMPAEYAIYIEGEICTGISVEYYADNDMIIGNIIKFTNSMHEDPFYNHYRLNSSGTVEIYED